MAVLAEGVVEAIPGDPVALYEAADEMDRAARDFEDAADSIGAHGRQVTANWYGSASEAAGEHIRGLATRVRVGNDVYTGVAKVIRAYAAGLAAAQDAWSDASTRAAAASTALGQAHVAAAAALAMPTTDASGQVDYAAASAQAIAADDAALAVRSAGAALDAAREDMAAAVAAALAANEEAARQVEACTDQLAAMGGRAASPVGVSTASGSAVVALAEGARVIGTSSRGELQGWDGSIEWAGGQEGGAAFLAGSRAAGAAGHQQESGWDGAWHWVEGHASQISSIAGTAAAVTAFIPGVDLVATPLLLGVAVGAGALATTEDVQRGDTRAAVEDGVGTALNLVPGVGMLRAVKTADRVVALVLQP